VSRETGPHRGVSDGSGRFPGFDVLSQARHWDGVTAEVVTARLGPPSALKFFTGPEAACARVLLNLLTGQDEPENELTVPVLEMVDSRLEAGETDGWRYEDMPEDGQAWRDTLCYLDADAGRRCGTSFADAPDADQAALVQAVQDLKSADWHGLPAGHVWSLWTRYACTAFYAHPFAWSEIGFPGPAYPRGYKNAGVGKLEPFEVHDARPAEDPVKEDA
jgi:Gluconate 2-dehydrogenase subunit 3